MTRLAAGEALELARSVRAVCDRMASPERVREIAFAGNGFDSELWLTLCGQVGVAAMALPEELGGAACDASALGVVANELGRALAPVPFVASAVLATGLLLDCKSHALLDSLADGTRTAAAVVCDGGGAWDPGAVSVRAVELDGGWCLHGAARHILNGASADDLVVVALAGTRAVLVTLESSSAGVTVEAEKVLDGTRPMATVTFSGALAQPLIPEGNVEEVVHRNVQRATAILSAEQVGAHERVLEIATEYARVRHQFGRPIGSFQAIKHRCADVLVGLEWSRSASQAALQSLDDDPPGSAAEADWRITMAKAVCSEELRAAAHSNLQIHGGIGFTWEDSAHLYLRRARSDEVIFGGPGLMWDRLAAEADLL
jgi:alkylation response protein AidB-like acyl-CoA dehydrogenase